MSNPINRRTAVSILAASATTPLWSTTTTPGATTSADAAALKILDQTARSLGALGDGSRSGSSAAAAGGGELDMYKALIWA